MILKVTLKQLMASGRLSKDDLAVARAGAKTARDPYTAGFTRGGARIDVSWNRETKRFTYELSGYTPDGSDCKLENA